MTPIESLKKLMTGKVPDHQVKDDTALLETIRASMPTELNETADQFIEEIELNNRFHLPFFALLYQYHTYDESLDIENRFHQLRFDKTFIHQFRRTYNLPIDEYLNLYSDLSIFVNHQASQSNITV